MSNIWPDSKTLKCLCHGVSRCFTTSCDITGKKSLNKFAVKLRLGRCFLPVYDKSQSDPLDKPDFLQWEVSKWIHSLLIVPLSVFSLWSCLSAGAAVRHSRHRKRQLMIRFPQTAQYHDLSVTASPYLAHRMSSTASVLCLFVYKKKDINEQNDLLTR